MSLDKDVLVKSILVYGIFAMGIGLRDTLDHPTMIENPIRPIMLLFTLIGMFSFCFIITKEILRKEEIKNE